MTGGSCALDSALPETVTYSYFAVYLILALYGSITSYIKSKQKNEKKWKTWTFEKKLTEWWTNLKRLKHCYIPALAHLLDQASDVGVLIQFYQLKVKEDEYGGDYCKGTYYLYPPLFFLPLFSLRPSLAAIHRPNSSVEQPPPLFCQPNH